MFDLDLEKDRGAPLGVGDESPAHTSQLMKAVFLRDRPIEQRNAASADRTRPSPPPMSS
jgi:hypothetical protein